MKKNILIITILLLIIIIIVFVVFITYFKDDYSNVNLNSSDIMNDISLNLGNDMTPMILLEEQQVKDTYDIDVLKLESYVIKIPIMNIRADEIAIIKVKNIRDIEYVKSKLKFRLRNIENTFERYLQDQFELVKNSLIISRGKYILMSISDRNDDIENTFRSYFENNKK
ncbi:MAG: DUF4358 domain-containing protein [Clostridia bacterium]|nr:DUF4358 domain-containing protein [Clostridia bacterium]MDD4386181.1 DUF4358 domain-containing protein [Clostridia bacterium]